MGKLILSLFFTFFSLLCFSQQLEKDSLLLLLKTMPDDTSKALVYSKLSVMYSRTYKNDGLARKYADSLKALSEVLGFEKGIADANYRYGGIDRFQGNHRSAIKHFQEFLGYYKTQGDSVKVAWGLYQMGVVYGNLGDLDKSLASYFRALSIQEKVNDQREMASLLNSIGNIYRKMGKPEDAISMYLRANTLFESLNIMKSYAMGLQNIGNAYMVMEEFDEAEQKYKDALLIVQNLGEDLETGMVLSNLGNFYQLKGQNEKALTFLFQSLAIRRTLPHKRSTAFILERIGEVYTKLNKYNEATKYFDEGLALAKEINSKDLLQDFYQNFAELYKAQGNFKKAYGYYELSVQMKDSMFNLKNSEVINELQTKYETEKKDQQITLLAKEKELQKKETQRQTTLKNTFVLGAILIALLASLFLYTLRQRMKNQKALTAKNEEIKEVNFKRQLSELEMKALQAQINPHFIFNCMNSINEMILEGNNKNASKYLTKFSKLIRLILENAEATEVSLKNEFALLEAYIQLESLRFSGDIKYQIQVDEEIDPENTYLPSMVIQPFVENAIWHGLRHKKEPNNGQISIAVKQDQNQLTCLIEDNGVGREKASELQKKTVWKSKSLGLKITEERLQLLSKEIQKQLVHITDLKDWKGDGMGTRVEVNIPIS